MIRVIARRNESERGAVLVIFALAMTALITMVAIALDLSYGFVQNRRAQNASDFAAFAVSQALNGTSTCNGTSSTPNMQQIVNMVQDVVNDNASAVGTGWTATFLDGTGKALTSSGSTFTSASAVSTSYPPFGACGVAVNSTPAWNTFFAGVAGIPTLKGNGSGSVANKSSSTPISIISLNEVGPHAVLGGGTGNFIVNGDMVLYSDVSAQPWTATANGYAYDDVVDAKAGSNLSVYGTIHTVNGTYSGSKLWPLDWCFDGTTPEGSTTSATGDPSYPGGTPLHSPHCSEGNVSFSYNHIALDTTAAASNPDPLKGSGAPTNPFSSGANVNCPGVSTTPQYASLSAGETSVGGVTYLRPGEYTSAVQITGTVVFGDCEESSNPSGYPGIYKFDHGLWIDPLASGNTVTGSNIVIATQAPYPTGGNVADPSSTSSVGNGAPCLPSSTISSASSGGVSEVDTTHPCSGTTNDGVRAFHDGPNGSCCSADTSQYGTGNNFSLIIGGVSGASVSLTGPTFGGYGGSGSDGLILYQDANTQANYGFNAESGDSASITLNGVVYNGSLSSYGANAPQDFWDATVGGIPFYAGGTLQTGYGAGWTNGPAASAGSVTLNGTAVVDDFNTDGGTTITILGQPYSLPGGGSLSFVG